MIIQCSIIYKYIKLNNIFNLWNQQKKERNWIDSVTFFP